MSTVAKQPALDPGLAALVDLLVEFAVDDFFAEMETRAQPEQEAAP